MTAKHARLQDIFVVFRENAQKVHSSYHRLYGALRNAIPQEISFAADWHHVEWSKAKPYANREAEIVLLVNHWIDAYERASNGALLEDDCDTTQRYLHEAQIYRNLAFNSLEKYSEDRFGDEELSAFTDNLEDLVEMLREEANAEYQAACM